jgi:hypothetical protein
MKVLHVIFSTNRLKYLGKALESHAYLNYGDHEIDRVVIDDYPRTRNDKIFEILGKTFAFRPVLHTKNKGLSATWSELFDWIKEEDYDYILHQEDDVVLKQMVYLDQMISLFAMQPKICSFTLKRQPWYFHEKESKIEPTDLHLGSFYAEKANVFSPMFTLYPTWIAHGTARETYQCNINEGMLNEHLKFQGFTPYVLKGSRGEHLIEHIGEETQGTKCLEGEPNWELFAKYDPNKVYSSRDGSLIRA